MKNYKIELLSLGDMTQLPDSQKVFGALIYLFAERYGDERAADFVKNILKREIHCEISNVVPYDYFPMPQDYMIEKCSLEDDKSRKEQYSEIKQRDYIKRKELVKLFQNNENDKETFLYIFPYIKVEIRQLLRASIDSIRYNNPAFDSQLYSVPIVRLSEVTKLNIKTNEEKSDGKLTSTPVNKFCFYLQIDHKAEELLIMLKEAENRNGIIVLGKRVSQGLNLFQIKKITEENISIKESDLYLNMGMLLPDQIQFSKSTIRLFTSERRPYQMRGGWQKFDKQFISFIAEGSIIAREDNLENMGKSIESPFDRARDIVFGNSYLYPLPKKGE